MKVGTGLVQGAQALPNLVEQAVKQALHHADLEIASSVLLFLSRDFAEHYQPAVRAAAKVANTMQVSGCCAHGIFTEQDWVLDGPAAAALVLGDGVAISGARDNDDELLLTFTAPNAFNTSWMNLVGKRFGAVAGDATGQGHFPIWKNGKQLTNERCDLQLMGMDRQIVLAHAAKQLTTPQQIEELDGHELVKLSNISAWHSLRGALDNHAVEYATGLPYHQLVVLFADTEGDVQQGNCQLTSIIDVDIEKQVVVLADKVAPGSCLSWGLLDPDAAQQNLLAGLRRADGQLSSPPAFGLMFSCLSRGPQFYNGLDQDIALLKRHYPEMPFIGFYGNGEIAPLNGRNSLLQHFLVLGLFSAES